MYYIYVVLTCYKSSYILYILVIVVALVPVFFYSQKNTMSGILDNLGPFYPQQGRALVPEPGPRQAAPRQVMGTPRGCACAGGSRRNPRSMVATVDSCG